MASVFASLASLLTIGDVLLVLLFLLLLNQLMELYELRGMPPGPRFYSLPFLGNILSMNSEGDTVYDNTRRFVCYLFNAMMPNGARHSRCISTRYNNVNFTICPLYKKETEGVTTCKKGNILPLELRRKPSVKSKLSLRLRKCLLNSTNQSSPK